MARMLARQEAPFNEAESAASMSQLEARKLNVVASAAVSDHRRGWRFTSSHCGSLDLLRVEYVTLPRLAGDDSTFPHTPDVLRHAPINIRLKAWRGLLGQMRNASPFVSRRWMGSDCRGSAALSSGFLVQAPWRANLRDDWDVSPQSPATHAGSASVRGTPVFCCLGHVRDRACLYDSVVGRTVPGLFSDPPPSSR